MKGCWLGVLKRVVPNSVKDEEFEVRRQIVKRKGFGVTDNGR